MRRNLFKIIACLLTLSADPIQAGSDTGSTITPDSIHIQRCSACHYRDGQAASPDFPNISGQYEIYLMKALKLFKEHKRESEAMELISSLHKEQELVILANFYAKQKPAEKPPITNPEMAKWARGQQIFTAERVYGIACADCHGADAKGYVRQSPRSKSSRAMPNLAGQQPGYLKTALKKYTEKEEHFGMCAMRKAGKTLSQSDIDALVEYISSKSAR